MFAAVEVGYGIYQMGSAVYNYYNQSTEFGPAQTSDQTTVRYPDYVTFPEEEHMETQPVLGDA